MKLSKNGKPKKKKTERRNKTGIPSVSNPLTAINDLPTVVSNPLGVRANPLMVTQKPLMANSNHSQRNNLTPPRERK